MQVGSLEIQLLADMARLKKDMDTAKGAVTGAMREIETAVAGAKGALVGLASVFSIDAAKAYVHGILEGIAALKDLKEATGSTVENISALEDVAKRTGTSFETVGTALVKFNASINASTPDSNAKKAFEAIGLSVTTLKALDPAEALRVTAVALSGYADTGDKARLMQELFGKSLREVAPFLNDLAEKNKLVAKVTTQAAEETDKFNKELDNLHKNSLDSARAIAGPLVSAANDLIGKWREARAEGRGLLEILASRYWDNVKDFYASMGIGKKKPEFFIDYKLDESAAETARLQRKKEVAFTAGKERTGAQDHFADNLINELITQYNNLTGSMSKVDEVTRKLNTSSKDVTAAQRAQALELAAGIDIQNKMTAASKNAAELMTAELDAREKLADAARATLEVLESLSREQQFELTLLNKQPDVINKARFEREMLNKELAASNALLARGLQEGWDYTRMQEEQNKVTRAAAEARAAFDAIQADANDKMYNPDRGVSDGVKDYMDEIAKSGDIMKRAVTGAFKSMEDALVKFVTTGKLDFKSLANGIIADLVRIQIQQSITGPLAAQMQSGGGLGGLLSNVFRGTPFGFPGGYGGVGGVTGGFNTLGFGGTYADGGRPPVGVPSLVGERGQELFIPDTAGTIIPNGKLGQTITLQTNIQIDSRTDRAEVYGNVSRAIQESNRRFAEQLANQGVLQR